MALYLDRLIQLIEATGGIVEERQFVTKPGIVILEKTEVTPEAKTLFDLVNIDTARPEYEQAAEFKSRLTYLSFPEERKPADTFNERMARMYQHLSVHAPTYVTFLLAGISVETSMELIAHNEARVARLTSSKTKAMDETLYRVQGTPAEQEMQQNYLREFIAFRKAGEGRYLPRQTGADALEIWNRLNTGAKATALTYTMNLKDYHKLFIGRIPSAGNEAEVREVCAEMCNKLHTLYPLVIFSPEEYKEMNNGEKYKS